jgi:urea transport system ATP-binding protein
MNTKLQVKGLNVAYGESLVLRDVDFKLQEGTITAVMGRNGVGKTSFLKGLMGLLPARSGEIELDGQPIHDLSTDKRARRGIALVPQGREIFPKMTVRENLIMGLEVLPRAERKLPEELIYDLFPVLSQMGRRMGGNLSGGQQQQLSIARALAGNPSVLMLDEPTEGLQPSIILDIESVLNRLNARGGISIVLVEQYLAFAQRLADHYYIFDRGSVVFHGTRKDLTDAAIKKYLTF